MLVPVRLGSRLAVVAMESKHSRERWDRSVWRMRWDLEAYWTPSLADTLRRGIEINAELEEQQRDDGGEMSRET